METNQYLKMFETLRDSRKDEPSWLLRLREEAMDSFAKKGFPTTRDDAWRYTDLAPVREGRFERDGSLSGEPSLSVQEGVEVLDIFEAVKVFPELLEKHLGRYADPEKDPFTALNAALFHSGNFIRISDGVILEEPIQIVHSAASGGEAAAFHPRTLILMGKGSKASVVETYASEDGNASVGHPRMQLSGIQASSGFPLEACGNDIKGCPHAYFTNSVTEIVLEEGARLEHCKIQQESPEAFHIATTHVVQRRGSSFVSFAFSTGARLMRNDCRVVLAEEGVSCELNGLYLGDKDQVLDHQTFVDHQKPDGKSDQFFKGLLAGNARGVFRGHVRVCQDAQRTDAHQTNKNLLLSDTAKVDTQPQLEILADDVKCSHGAAVGQLQEDALFYLRSRGIGEPEAARMLAQGFAREVIEQSSLGFMREELTSLVNAKLEKQIVSATHNAQSST
jgi:Fe-S cluster assembly protein SufD